MSTYRVGNLGVMDLTKVLGPKAESRRCGLIRFSTSGPIPDFHTIMDSTSRLGTHVECPYHHSNNWFDVESLSITVSMGRAIYISIEGCEPNRKVTGGDLEKACGDRIKEGGIVIIGSPMKLAPFTPDSNTEEDRRLFICRETAEWFREKKVKCVGFGNGISIEGNNEDVYTFHDVLTEVNCMFLEVLRNLEGLTTDIFFMSYSLLPIKGPDPCPIRVYAIEGPVEFSR